MTWLFECRNPDCDNHGLRAVIYLRKVGPFWEHPQLWCTCGQPPERVERPEKL